MRRRTRSRILALSLLMSVTAFGCAWQPDLPPTAGGSSMIDRYLDEPVVVIGRLGNPGRAHVQWGDIGAGMSAAMAARLRKNSRYDAWVDAPFAAAVVKTLNQVGDSRTRGLERLRKQNPNVYFVVTGAVTDFAHSVDLPSSVRRRGLFGSEKEEAIVAIRLEVIDLELGRVVASDHIYGAASAAGESDPELYANMAFGSYLFWSTPLGQASEQAIDRAIDQLDARLVFDRPLRHTPAQPRRIARQTGPRTVQLASEVDARSEGGRLYFVCLVDSVTGVHHAVFDPETGYPLKAQLERPGLGLTTRTALLLGRKPPTVDLRGAMLCPVTPDDEVVADGR